MKKMPPSNDAEKQNDLKQNKIYAKIKSKP